MRFGICLGAVTIFLNVCGSAAVPENTSDLYSPANIWPVHLKFTAEQWRAMEPKGGPGGGFGPFGGGGPRRGGGPGGPGPGPGGFGPAMFIAPAFLRDGDADRDGQLSRDEFQALGKKWFSSWDAQSAGKVSADQLRERLTATLLPPGMMGPPGGGPGGGGGFQMSLQGPEGQRNGIAARMGIQFDYVHADLDFAGKKFENVAARYKGNGTFLQSRGSEKRPLKVDLNRFKKDTKLASITTLNLHNNITDPSWMNENLAFRLYRDAGLPAPRSSYARVNITVPGERANEYFGLYSIVEDIDKSFIEDRFKTKGGAILKPVTPSLFSDLGGDWSAYKQTYDPKTDLSKEEIARIIETCRFVTKSTDEQFAARLGDFIELESFARYIAVTVFLSDLDGILGPGQNFYLYLHPQTKKYSFIAWDQDHSFGQMRGGQEEREQLSIHKPWLGENRFLERVFKVPAFKDRYIAALNEFNKSLFKPERLAKQVDELALLLRPAVREESADKLENFQAAVSGKSPDGDEFAFRRFGQGKPIKGFVPARFASISDQLAGKSEGATINNMGFGPGPGGGGGRGAGPRMGGPGGAGPGMMLGNIFLDSLDANKDRELSAAEATQGFTKWFTDWNTDKSNSLSNEELTAGINKDLTPFRGPPPNP